MATVKINRFFRISLQLSKFLFLSLKFVVLLNGVRKADVCYAVCIQSVTPVSSYHTRSQHPVPRVRTAFAVYYDPFPPRLGVTQSYRSGSKTSRREGPAPELTDLIGDGYTRPIREGDGSTPWIGGSGFAGCDRRRRFLGGSAAAARDGRRLAAELRLTLPHLLWYTIMFPSY
ncbi:hypothetical protein F2Q69_00005292 [Brassica cretica]|uniref:Uncharacterized protein n=1 Tax=Brassica cretica TaxID=69181 RepID=A0A8S9PCD5_BRACR|nr:hypothetical protein F2Q69_00005292 [Brassica cretica]